MDNTNKSSILIVDDDDFNLSVLSEILKPEYNIYKATRGERAIEMAGLISPDLILLDIVMPDMNGFDVLSILKHSEATKKIPVIIISMLEDVEDEAKGLNLDAADYIHKPFNVKIVRLKVRNQMQIVNQMKELIELKKKLEIAVVDAQTANKAKSSFLARMSHEIRTPLNAVLGISEINLQNDNLPYEIKEAFLRIYDSGDHLLNIINDILDISKIEAGKLELVQVQYQVSGMIYDTVFVNVIKNENNGIEFIVNVDENVPSMLIGDEIRIKQILNNLISNAFKYTAAGKVEFSVKAEKSASGSINIIFNVRDTGQGMTKEQLSKLFDEYARFNMETNRTTIGTGLGMGITHNLIRMMDGEIEAESERGKGSNFTVRIPQHCVNDDVLGIETVEKLRQFRSSYENKEKIVKIKREKMPAAKVLIVDDIDMNLYVTRGMLSPYGLQVNTALSGAEAIEKIINSKETGSLYDVVFMDHMMPVMDGIEAVKIIRGLGGEYEKLPIVALTANAVTGMKEKFLASGFNGFISKPVNIMEMDCALREWISPDKIIKGGDQENENTDASEYSNKFVGALSRMNEINTEIGLNYVSGSKDMYFASIDIFYNKLEWECGKMADFLKSRDDKNFLISIHAMKSMLALLGISELSETAREMEIQCGENNIDYCINRFDLFKERLFAMHKKLANIYKELD